MKVDMKLIRLFTLAFLLIGLNLSTYAGDDGGGKFGIRAGYSASNIYDGSSPLNSNALGSFYVGFFKEHKIVPMLHFSSGLEYSQIGSMENSNNKITMHYLSIPISFKFKIGPVYALAGASSAFKVGEKWTIAGEKEDPIIKANWFDIPVHVGLGIQILMLRIEARYHWGTMSLYDTPIDGYKTQAFQLGLGIAI